MPLTTISKLAPFSALIMSIVFVVYFILRFYLLEGYLLKRLYGATYTTMDETVRRGFVNHHIAGGTKIFILIAAIYPFISVVFVTSNFHTRISASSPVTMGDILIVVSQMLIAMYIFELFYRPKISPVSVGHHVGTIMIGQSAIAISLEIISEPDADIEFSLCLVWGAFDIISEFLPHVGIILYRVYPESHAFLRKLFLAAMATTLTGTISETILTMYMFGSLWNRWTLAFKITTPMLHVLFAAAQLWGSWNFYCLYQRQCRFLVASREQDARTTEEAKPAVDKSSNPVNVLPIDAP
ncbi:hypothetical protein DHEL01_v204311 [Diaporthe helianthi]|uniref:TLC domain-containing protein n=1 Tax=Diaporthe helianthi TaxID=158607 RepID=A0A2P5I460_DIAHE|nr:hypothetical protein DHEL01_v204311 [Diaporthe helianthi]